MQLLSPGRLGSLSIPNRVLFAPLTRVRADADNVPGDLMAEYYVQRASAGLLIAEATMVAADAQAWPHQPGIHSLAHVAGWQRVTNAVHAAGGRIYLQIWHPGRATHPALNKGAQPVSSSAKPIRDDTIHTPEGKQPYPTPRALRTDEIPGIVASFAKAAENAKLAGFDGVQVHGAHGYLIDQFLRDGVNDRTDAYGGASPTARACSSRWWTLRRPSLARGAWACASRRSCPITTWWTPIPPRSWPTLRARARSAAWVSSSCVTTTLIVPPNTSWPA